MGANIIQRYILTILAVLLFTQRGVTQTTDAFTDPRDGQTYKTITFNSDSAGATFTWMAQNLNYKMHGSFAYHDTIKYRSELGLLYTWEAARNACPVGWHLPTDSEWFILVNKFGGTDKAGVALKSIIGWDEDGNGTNSSGFGALPGGQRRPEDSVNFVVGRLGFWWTSTAADWEGAAWLRSMHYDYRSKTKVFRFDGNVFGGASVRCVRTCPQILPGLNPKV